MIRHYYECDVCGKKLPTEIKKTPFGQIEVVSGVGTTKEWDTKRLFQHLCKECALTIDNALLRVKMQYLSSAKKGGGEG